MTNSAMENSMFFFRYDPSISINGPSKNHGELIKGGAPDNQRVCRSSPSHPAMDWLKGASTGNIGKPHESTQ